MLAIENVAKSFDDQPVLRDVSLRIGTGEVVVLLGPSGCGKTTLLRIIAGLETVDNGRLLLNDQDLTQLPVHKRGFGMVFQDYALFPHKNVFENVAFGLRMLGWERQTIFERVGQTLTLVGLSGFDDRPIYDLSGGERQRVALARSLAPAPRLLLLDEPLGALDRALRERLMLDLRAILKRAGSAVGRPEGITAVYVTHDQAEAFAIADRIAVMNDGRIEQDDSPANLYRSPATPFVARFLGMDNVLEGGILSLDPLIVRVASSEWQVAGGESHLFASSPVHLLIRPDAGRLLREGEAGEPNMIDGRLDALSFRGRYQIATISTPQSPIALKFEFDTAVSLPPTGSKVRIVIEAQKIQLLASN
ncbi:MAG: ABC transporter ATP-binding protein [Chloroflexi bacterium]|nr:ABC transporter ATP-binding protein [Chloroflexota bacterium]